jgi:hypothetical protein
MKTRMTIAAVALGLCLAAGCGGSAQREQQRKDAEEKAAAEERSARLKADLEKLGGVWQRTSVKVNDGKTDVVPTLEFRLEDQLLGRLMEVAGRQVAGESVPAYPKRGDFHLHGEDGRTYVVWGGASPELKFEYELDGDVLKLKCDKTVDVVGLSKDFDLSGEWTRLKQ